MARLEASTSTNGANENVLEIDGCISSPCLPAWQDNEFITIQITSNLTRSDCWR